MTLPARMKTLRLQGDFPVPYIVLVDDAGVADFTATDLHKWSVATGRGLCGICGHKLDYWLYFIGGPASMESRTFFDPAMHEECSRYSLSVCPYLSGLKGYREQPREHAGYVTGVKNVMTASDVICLGRTRNYKINHAEHLITADAFVDIETFSRNHTK